METGTLGGSRPDPLRALADRAARSYGWRVTDGETGDVRMRVCGDWSDYDLAIRPCAERNALAVRCAFALAPPAERWGEVVRLADNLNRRFYRGALELNRGSDRGIYCDWVPLDAWSGRATLAVETMRAAVGTCDLMLFPAFHSVAWAEISAEAALGTIPLGEMPTHSIH